MKTVVTKYRPLSRGDVVFGWVTCVVQALLLLQRLVSGQEPGWLAVVAAGVLIGIGGQLWRHYRHQKFWPIYSRAIVAELERRKQ